MRNLSAVLVLGVVSEAFVVPTLSYSLGADCRVHANRPKPSSTRASGLLPHQTVRRHRAAYPASCRAPRMQLEEWLEDSEAGEQEEKGYADVTVREAVEWTLSKDSDFVYVDVRSAEEHEKLATPRGSVCIPGFERANPPAAASEGGEEGGAAAERDRPPVYEEDYNYEKMEWKLLPDFVDRMKTQFALDDKLLIGCKTNRSAEACRLLAEAGFTQVFNVESQLFMRTRAPEVWE